MLAPRSPAASALVLSLAASLAASCGGGAPSPASRAPADLEPPAARRAPLARPPDPAAADAVSAAVRAHEILSSVSVVPGDSARLAGAALAALAAGLGAPADEAPWSGDPERDRGILRERCDTLVAAATRPAPPDLPAQVARAMAAVAGDPHAFALEGDQIGSLLASISGEPFAGLGFAVHASPGGGWVVSEVYPDGPAAAAGLRPGDLVAALDGRPLDAASWAETGRALRPPQPVSLTGTRSGPDGAAPLTLELIAVRIRPPIVEHRIMPGKVGYLRIHYLPHAEDPGSDAAVLVAGALDAFDRARVTRMVIDLRDNAGGAPFDVASILVRGNPLLRIAVPGADAEPLARTVQPWKVRRKAAVLVNDQSYAAAEMIALALRDHGEARLFGQPTGGALTMPGQAALPGGVLLFFPQALVVGASGASPPGRRLEPDELVANPGPADYAAGRDPQLSAAVAWLVRR
jgi:carboxyl-terminal processing protease